MLRKFRAFEDLVDQADKLLRDHRMDGSQLPSVMVTQLQFIGETMNESLQMLVFLFSHFFNMKQLYLYCCRIELRAKQLKSEIWQKGEKAIQPEIEVKVSSEGNTKKKKKSRK